MLYDELYGLTKVYEQFTLSHTEILDAPLRDCAASSGVYLLAELDGTTFLGQKTQTRALSSRPPANVHVVAARHSSLLEQLAEMLTSLSKLVVAHEYEHQPINW